MRRRWQTAGIVALIVLALVAWFAWYNFFRVVPQPQMTGDARFMYGSLGAEESVGIPYWIMYVLPRVFPDKLPGPNGYMSMGINWETGKELPIGFTKMTVGFDRVANNCAACHVARYRVRPWTNPKFVPTGPNHTFNLEAFFRLLSDCAADPRFNSSTLMSEIELDSNLSWTQRQIYRFILIPLVKRRLMERRERFQWIYIHGLPMWPDWGRGRDDAMNLTKYFLTTSPVDDTLGPTDMPSIWNLGKYRDQPHTKPTAPSYNCEQGTLTRLNFAGDSCDANSVIIDSALGLILAQPQDNAKFLAEKDWLYQYLSSYPPPKFREAFPDVVIKQADVDAGRQIFAARCAGCHWSKVMADIPAPAEYRTGSVVPVEEVGTDRARIDSWNKEAAIRSNEKVREFGIERHGLVEAKPYGYVAAFLDGIWLRAPYLHNGSVPTLRDLLEAPDKRPPAFYRGYDVYDTERGGFISTKEQADRLGAKWGYKPDVLWNEIMHGSGATYYDTTWRSNGKEGHNYGTDLTDAQKNQLVEYLKTL
jgi:mono/diheme cytochrome c family protein